MPSLAPFSLPGKFWRGNLHTHSQLSDGALPPAQVVEAYRQAGYDFLTLSEHFVSHYNWPIADTKPFRSHDFTTLLGAELHAPETSVGELWHILSVGLPEDFTLPMPEETGPQLAARARAHGAFIGIAHPSWSRLTIEDGRALASTAHAVEIYNHGCATENDLGEGWYLMDQLLNEGHHLSAFATDDAHFKTPDYFGGWVNVKAESLEPASLLSALKAGHYYSSQGPIIEDITVEGHDISIRCSPVDTITVLCGNSRTLVRNAKAITSATLDLRKLDQGWLLRKPSDWIRIVCIDQGGKRAWSNPIWRSELV